MARGLASSPGSAQNGKQSKAVQSPPSNGLKLQSASNSPPKSQNRSAKKPKKPSKKSMFMKYVDWLHEPVHSSTIAIFRILYALCILAQLGIWWDMFEEFNKSYAMFPYPMMGWVKPLSPANGMMLLKACGIFSILQAIGFLTPIVTFLNFVAFSWLFFMCESNHNNHYLLMVHLTFCGAFLGWGKWMSVDQLIRAQFGKRPDPRVPRWSLYVCRLLFLLPYLYGAFAKMNYDWMFRAQPIAVWFEGRGGLYDESWFHWFICLSGWAFDLVISFLLLYKPTRYILGFPGSLAFNIGNKIMLNIGIFPMMMIASLMLFIEPYQPAQLVSYIFRTKVYGMPGEPTEEEIEAKRSDKKSKKSKKFLDTKIFSITLRQWWGVIFFSSFVLFHAFNPLREKVLYPDNPSWTEEGHFGAWHMKLRTKNGLTIFNLEEENGTTWMLDPEDDKNVYYYQRYKVPHKPHMTLLYVNRLKSLFEAAGRPLKSIKAESCFSLNDRAYHQLFMPDANLLDFAGTKYEALGVTGVGNFLYGDEQGPRCRRKDLRAKYDAEESKRMLAEVWEPAGIFRTYDKETGVRMIKRKTPEGIVEDAYMWPMFE